MVVDHQYVNLLISSEGTGLGNILLCFGELESNPCRFGQGSNKHSFLMWGSSLFIILLVLLMMLCTFWLQLGYDILVARISICENKHYLRRSEVMWQGHEWYPDVPIFGCWKMMMMACLKQISSVRVHQHWHQIVNCYCSQKDQNWQEFWYEVWGSGEEPLQIWPGLGGG